MDREHNSSVASQSQEFLPVTDIPLKGTPAYRRYARGAQKCYKPTSTQRPFLVCILLLIFGLIAIVEVACHNYPVENYQSALFGLNLFQRDWAPRSEEVSGTYGLGQDGTVDWRRLLSRNETTQSSEPDGTSATIAGAYIPTTTESSQPDGTSATVAGAYIPTTTQSLDPDGTSATIAGAYIPTTTESSQPDGTSATVAGAYIPTTTQSLDPDGTSATIAGAYIPTTTESSQPDGTSTTIAGAYIPTTTSPPSYIISTGYNLPSSYIPPNTANEGAYIPTTTSSELATTPEAYIPTAPGSAAPSAYVPSSVPEEGSTPTSSSQRVITTVTLPDHGVVEVETGTTIPGAYITTTGPPSAVTTVIVGATDGGAYIGSPTNSGYHPFKTIQSGYLDPQGSSSDSRGGLTVEGGGSVSTTITLPDGDITGTTIEGGYIPTSSIQFPSATDGAYIPTTGTQSVVTTIILPGDGRPGLVSASSDTPGTEPGAFIPVTQSMVPVSTVISGGTAVVMMGTPTTTALVPISTVTSGGVAVVVVGLPTSTSLVPISTITSDGAAIVLMGTLPISSLIPISTIISGGITKVVYGSPAETGILPQPITSKPSQTRSYSVITTLVTSTSGSVAYVYNTTMTLGPTTSIAPATQAAATAAPINEKSALAFTPLSYFAAWYLPTIVAVALRTIWTVVYNNARMMEPFYRLASPAGVSGRHSLNLLYLSMGNIVPEPILALFSGHSYMVVVSSITYIVELVAPLSSEFLAVDVQHGCTPAPGADVNHPCPPRLIIRLLPARILQGVLGLIGLLIITTVFLGYWRQPGIYSDPSCIATMASLLHHPDILDDFKELADADDAEVSRLLHEQTYRLAHYQAGAEGMKYGLVPVMRTNRIEIGTKGDYSAVSNPENATLVRRHRRSFLQRHFWRTLGDIALGGLLLGLLGVVVGFYLDGNPDGFNRFFLSQSFGPRFILVFAGGLIVTQWKRLEREVRTYQPYRHLSSKATSSPTHTILSTTTSSPWTTLPTAVFHFHFFTALIAFCYIISEVLVIVVATIPYSNNQYYLAFISGTYITFGILGLQILVFAFTVTWWRWKGPRLERDPDTLLGVWTLLAHSEIRGDFEDLGTAGRRDLVETVKAWGNRYWLGEAVATDGVARMGIHGEKAETTTKFEGLRVVHPDGVVSHVQY